MIDLYCNAILVIHFQRRISNFCNLSALNLTMGVRTLMELETAIMNLLYLKIQKSEMNNKSACSIRRC